MAEKFKAEPKVRPTNLPELDEFPKDVPVKIPGDDGDEATFAWCEKLRDFYQEQGNSLSKSGLYEMGKIAGLDGNDLAGFKRQVDGFYKNEAKTSKPPKEKKVTATKTKPAKTKPAAKKKAVAKDKTAPAKTSPNVNGHRGHGDAKIVLEKTVRGLKVVASKTDNGRTRVTINDVPLRGLMRYMGSQKYSSGEARNACSVLLKDLKNGDQYVAELVQEGHVGVGRKKSDSFGENGGLPKLDADTKKAVLSLPK